MESRLNKDKTSKIISWVVLGVLGIFCYLYSIFWSYFAELNIQFSFLNFPIFVGEILLMFSMCILFIQWTISSIQFKLWHYGLVLYMIFILSKAFYGYFTLGPLAFRHAALFYYPLFALIGYYFYRDDFFKNRFIKYALLSLFAVSIFFILPHKTYYFIYCILVLLFLIAIKNKVWRYISIILFIIFCWEGFYNTIQAGRSVFVSSFAGYMFLSIILTACFINIKPIYKKIKVLFIMLCAFLIFWLGYVSDKIEFRSLTYLNNFLESYEQHSREIREKGKEVEMPTYPTRLYDKNFQTFPKAWPGFMSQFITETGTEPQTEKEPEFSQTPLYYRQKNLLFRLFMVQDMLGEVIKGRRIFGVDFGKPFRSKSLEVLDWDGGWRKRTGWMDPHNGYVHILYRAGIVGLLFIVIVLVIFARMVITFVRVRNIKGIFLCSGVLHWFLFAAFTVFLELPQWAIPFWSLFGIVLRYSHIQREQMLKPL